MSEKEMFGNGNTMMGVYRRETGDDIPNVLERAANGPN